MARRDGIKRLARTLGYEVRAYTPVRSFSAAREDLLRRMAIDVVVDVGANTGQYGAALRASGFAGRIVSLEPVPAAFADLERHASSDPGWTALRLAASDRDATVEMHVTAESSSSSVLPRNDQFDDRPGWAPKETRTVPARRLDSVASEILDPAERAHLKVDVQGYERTVIDGAGGCLDRFHGLELELSVRALYEGQVPMLELIPHLQSLGFALVSLEPILIDDVGRLMELDGLFMRDSQGLGHSSATTRTRNE